MGNPAKKALEVTEIETLERAYLKHYVDQEPLTKALAGAGVALSTYYRWRQAFPDEIEEIQGRAAERAATIARRRHAEFMASQVGSSLSVQKAAREGLAASVEELSRIARGEDRTIEGDKTIRTYPRDVIGAAQMLQAIATYGVLPENEAFLLQNEDASRPPPQFPGLDFSRVTATATDGTTVTLEKPDVLEGEFTVES